MKEQQNQLSPTDRLILFLEEASQHKVQWEMMKRHIEQSKVWQDNLGQSGIDIDRVRERIREIDFENREIR